MPLITSDKVMLLLDLKDQNLVPQIDALIPPMQNWVSDELNNWFHTENWVVGSGIAFDKAAGEITNSEGGFAAAGFIDETDIHVEGSKFNNKIFRVSEATDTVLSLEDESGVVTEAADNEIRLTILAWPVGLEMAAAKLIEHDLGKTKTVVETKTRPQEVGAYPAELLARFNIYRKLRVPAWKARNTQRFRRLKRYS